MAITRRVLYGKNMPVTSGTALTASGIVLTGSGQFHGFAIKCDGTNDVTVNVYDNVEASGTKLIPTDTIFDGTVKSNAWSEIPPISVDNGIYIKIAVAGGGACEIVPRYFAD